LLFSMGHEAMVYRHVAQPTLDELLDRLDSEELASAREAAAALDLDELVAETIREAVR
jgi:hypothetical protein